MYFQWKGVQTINFSHFTKEMLYNFIYSLPTYAFFNPAVAWSKEGLEKVFFMLFHEGACISILRFIALPVNIAYSLVALRNMEGNSPVRLKAITQNIEEKK